jgi:hypothetical protein
MIEALSDSVSSDSFSEGSNGGEVRLDESSLQHVGVAGCEPERTLM